jgi:hypothetical protein
MEARLVLVGIVAWMKMPEAAYPPTLCLSEKEALVVVFPRSTSTFLTTRRLVRSGVGEFGIEMGIVPSQEKMP